MLHIFFFYPAKYKYSKVIKYVLKCVLASTKEKKRSVYLLPGLYQQCALRVTPRGKGYEAIKTFNNFMAICPLKFLTYLCTNGNFMPGLKRRAQTPLVFFTSLSVNLQKKKKKV